MTLAAINAYGLYTIRSATSKRFGRATGTFFTLISCTQTLLPFWMGRTLPNMFALFPGDNGEGYWDQQPDAVCQSISLSQ